MDNELHGAAAHSHQYYTVENGDYDNNRPSRRSIAPSAGSLFSVCTRHISRRYS